MRLLGSALPRRAAVFAKRKAINSCLRMGLAETLPGDAIISLEELRRRIRSSSPAWQLYKMALNNERKGSQQEAFSLAVKARQMEPRLFQVRAALAAHYFLGCALQDMGIQSGEHFAAAKTFAGAHHSPRTRVP